MLPTQSSEKNLSALVPLFTQGLLKLITARNAETQEHEYPPTLRGLSFNCLGKLLPIAIAISCFNK